MSFIHPWYIPAIAAAATVPPLVLLYYLKLKRQEVPIASTMLWRQAFQDLQVNSPFQKLRTSLLLILQLLILLAAILAIAEPMLAGDPSEGQVQVLLIDHSASMAAREKDGQTRLEIAKREARKTIDNLLPNDRAMVIAFADRARVVCTLTGNKNQLRAAIDGIEQSDAPGRLNEAMNLAESPTSPITPVAGQDNPVESAKYVLFSDGRLADSDSVKLQRGAMEVVYVGEASDNVGIVDVDVRRNYEQPERLSILARVRNFGGDAETRDVTLHVDGQLKAVQGVEGLAPLANAADLPHATAGGMPPENNERTVTFDLDLDRAAQIELRLSGSDAFAADDRAYAIAKPPRGMTVLLVTPGNRYLRQLMDAMPLDRWDLWTPEEYENAADEQLIELGRCKYDVVVLDGHSTERLPPGNYLFLAGVPEIEGVERGALSDREVFLDWDDTHPILRHVAVEAIVAFSWYTLRLPENAETLIEATNGPVLSLLNRERNQYLLCAFGFFDESRTHLNTTWIFHEGVVVFMYNALRYLSGSTTVGQQSPVAPGEAFTVAAKPDLDVVTVRRPDGRSEKVPVRDSGLATYGGTDRVGIYTISTGIPGEDARAVNLLDEQESLIAPSAQLRVAAGEVTGTTAVERVNRPLWPYVLGALGVILALEWFVYNRRVWV